MRILDKLYADGTIGVGMIVGAELIDAWVDFEARQIVVKTLGATYRTTPDAGEFERIVNSGEIEVRFKDGSIRRARRNSRDKNGNP